MESTSLYSDEIWESFVEKILGDENEYSVKKYTHLDPHFNFQEDNKKIKALLKNSEKGIAQHSFLPFLKILISTPRYRYQENLKKHGLETKVRPICFASHFDTYIYAFYAHSINIRYQNLIKALNIDDCVLAYRRDLDGKSNVQFAKDVFDDISTKISEGQNVTAIALDITGYFDNIDHEILKKKWLQVIGMSEEDELPIDQYKVFRTLTKYSYVNKSSFLKHFAIDLDELFKQKKTWTCLIDLIPNKLNGGSFKEKLAVLRKRRLITRNKPKTTTSGCTINKGIPQGSAISAVLSNIYLIDFDKAIMKLAKDFGLSYRRYCDDLLIVCDSKDTEEISRLVLTEIRKYDLVIQEKKTEYIQFKENHNGIIRGYDLKKIKNSDSKKGQSRNYKSLQYLGFDFNGQNIYIRPSSLSRYFRKMKARIVKTVMMSYSDKSKTDKILRHQIYERYTSTGERNFISYALRSSQQTYTNRKGQIRSGLNSKSIRKQISKHIELLKFEIKKTSEQRYQQKTVKWSIKKGKGIPVKKPKLKS